MLALSKRFPAVVQGEDKPKDNAERLAFAQIAYDRKHFAVAARLWAEAIASDPKLGDDRRTQHRYNAACAAALAGAGQGKDVPPPDDVAKAKLRGQALDWLKADLGAWTKLLESGPPQARPAIVQTLQHWKVTPTWRASASRGPGQAPRGRAEGVANTLGGGGFAPEARRESTVAPALHGSTSSSTLRMPGSSPLVRSR